MDCAPLDARPVIVAIAGPNGAGETTSYHAHLRRAGLPFINADVLARELDLEPYAAARMADVLRREFVVRGSSFVFETVFSDPVGDKRAFLQEAAASGHTVVLCYVGLSGPDTCEARVAMRVSQGGHDVPTEKLCTRHPRTIKNLRAAICDLPHVLIYTNDDLRRPYRLVAVFEQGRLRSSKLRVWQSAHGWPKACSHRSLGQRPRTTVSSGHFWPKAILTLSDAGR